MFHRLFHRVSTASIKETEDVNETFRTLMDARFDRLEQNFVALRTEWADVYDKIMHLYDRTRKRVKKAEGAREEEITPQPVPEPVSATEQRERILETFRRQNGV